ncbi:MAG: hypothetical protein K8R58_12080 [Bacteroidales bacterium]|nr:hypothetical protein [Bacteroidales bacterium]
MIIVDESISPEKLTKVLTYLKFDEHKLPEIIHIKNIYPGIPDEEIRKHILKTNSIFITSDRVIHNKILLDSKRSIYIDNDGKITKKKLKGINIPKKNINHGKTELQDSYETKKIDIRGMLIPSSVQQLKKLRTKRRRIRNYFEGLINIENIDVSLSKKDIQDKMLIGLKIRIISNNGIKSLDASEIYILENKINDEKIYPCYILIALIRLILNTKKTTIFYDSTEINGDFETNLKTEFSELLLSLKSNFDQINFHPVNKGKNIELLRNKLIQLTKKDAGNEIITGDIMMIKQRLFTDS